MSTFINTLGHWTVVLLAFFLPLSTTATVALALLTVILWSLSKLTIKLDLKSSIISFKNELIALYSKKYFLPFAIFFLVFVVGSFYSNAPIEDIIASLRKMSKLLYIPFIAFFLNDEKWRNRFIFSFLSAVAISITIAFLSQYSPIMYFKQFSPQHIFKDRIHFSLLLAFSIFLLSTHLHSTKKTYKSENRLKSKITLLLSFLFILSACFYLFFFNTGRSGHLVFFLLFILFFTQKYKLKGFISSIIFLMLSVSFIFSYSKQFQFEWQSAYNNGLNYITNFTTNTTNNANATNIKNLNPQITSTGLRLEFMKNSIHIIKQKPIFGWGTGSFKSSYKSFYPNVINKTENVHCEYLNIMVQLGIMGLFAFFWLMWSQLKLITAITDSNKTHALSKTKATMPTKYRHLLQGIVCAICTGSLMNSWLMDFTSGYLFALFIALCASTTYQDNT